MKKAFLDSKWWFYIPIVSLFLIKSIAVWILDSKTAVEFNYRHILMSYSLFIHIIPIIWLFNLI
jgi:uncharacterized membrane protein